MTGEDTDQKISATMVLPSPSLVESLVFSPLDQPLSVLMSSSRNIKSLSRVFVDNDAGIVQSAAVVNRDNREKLVEGVRVKRLVSQDTFQADSSIPLG